MGISCVVFDIWPRDGQWQRTDGRTANGRTDVGKHSTSSP